VFGDGVALASVRLVFGPWRGPAITIGSTVLFAKAAAGTGDFARADLAVRAWFVHEIAHVWQFQHRPLWTLKSWLQTLLTGGYGPRRSGYRYPAAPVWRRLNLEQQAEIIADAYRRRCDPGLAQAADLDACLAEADLVA